MRRINDTYFTKRNQKEIQIKKFEKFILKYDVIHDALKLICNKTLKRPRSFGDIGSFDGNLQKIVF
jgi:hypothetical protein